MKLSQLQVYSVCCVYRCFVLIMELDGAVLFLEAKVAMLEREVKRLKEQNKELSVFKAKVLVLEQEKFAGVKQVQELAPSVKAGLPGTVKSLRTNQKVELAEILSATAINEELIVGISNNDVRDRLQAASCEH